MFRTLRTARRAVVLVSLLGTGTVTAGIAWATGWFHWLWGQAQYWYAQGLTYVQHMDLQAILIAVVALVLPLGIIFLLLDD